MACLYDENRVVIHDLETGEKKELEDEQPCKCAASQYALAMTTSEDGLHLCSTDGVLIHIVPESTNASCVVFHPRNANILAIGYKDGTVRMWDVSSQTYCWEFKEHINQITNIRFALDGHMFLSSCDYSSSIVTLDDQFQNVSSVKLKGHTSWVTDIIPLPISNQCITCSFDKTIKVWDCDNGACLRTLTEHTDAVRALALHPKGQQFSSGSEDKSIIIWSSETFEVLRRFKLPYLADSLQYGEVDTLYTSVYKHGVMSCNALTGKVGPVIIPAIGFISGIALGMILMFLS